MKPTPARAACCSIWTARWSTARPIWPARPTTCARPTACRRCRTTHCGRWSAAARAACSASPSASAPGDARFDALRDEFLARYAARMLRETRVFDAMAACCDALDATRLPWGIVTNKADALHRAAGRRPGPARARRGGDRRRHARRMPSRIRRRCWRRRAALGWRRRAASTSATTCATSRPGAPPAWPTLAAAWGYLGAGRAGRTTWGAEPCSHRRTSS